ncbi:hypothetical protein B7720_02340 [Streptococcus oralis subsp. oralis]|uniref:YopX family protein n=1 Tax=Streptococcus oralis TaxID=1303 RepID=UPI000A1138AF|nr:YopX family protein [Streptococcus oralis]ORO56477.1 hypothetical protein B7720_02340 [Streptococcus oralis subsp. oralis]
MTPKFRAWISEADTMANDLKGIDFENETVVLRKLYYEDGFPVETEVFEVEIGNAILMQSTGLFDINGKEVFVGDIVKCTRGCLHEVYLEKEYGGTFIGGMPAVYLKGLSEGYAWTGYEEIIGNVYENKELLEEKE